MKKLTRVKLINWHRFTNAMIELENSVLISGKTVRVNPRCWMRYSSW